VFLSTPAYARGIDAQSVAVSLVSDATWSVACRNSSGQRWSPGGTMLTEIDADHDGAAIVARLATVLDPELDQSIVELGFVQELRVHAKHAQVTLQLPTSWCAMNFAFLMAEDMRKVLLAADGIEHVTVRLGDHCAADEIEAAVNRGEPFSDAFSGEGASSLADLRATFLRKGFLVRQQRLLQQLRDTRSPEAIARLCVQDGLHVATADVVNRYLERRIEVGLDCSPSAPLIVDQNGAVIAADRLEAYYQQIRTVRVALEANGAFCRAVLARRTASRPPETAQSEGEANVQA
jgi:metal-sulfur cluster biosynthetic enzyme